MKFENEYIKSKFREFSDSLIFGQFENILPIVRKLGIQTNEGKLKNFLGDERARRIRIKEKNQLDLIEKNKKEILNKFQSYWDSLNIKENQIRFNIKNISEDGFNIELECDTTYDFKHHINFDFLSKLSELFNTRKINFSNVKTKEHHYSEDTWSHRSCEVTISVSGVKF
jgi:hypothetical protein